MCVCMRVCVCVCVCLCVCVCVCVCVFGPVCGWVGGLSLIMEIALNNWINSLNTTSPLDIRVAPATRTRGPLVIIIQQSNNKYDSIQFK